MLYLDSILYKKYEEPISDILNTEFDFGNIFVSTRENEDGGFGNIGIYVTLKDRHRKSFCLQELPGQCGTLLIYHMSHDFSSSNPVMPGVIREIAEFFAIGLGYSSLIFSQVANRKSIESWLKNGYDIVWGMTNSRTNNDVVFIAKEMDNTKVITDFDDMFDIRRN